MNYHKSRKGVDRKLSVKINKDQGSDHQRVDQKDKIKICGGNIDFPVLRKLVKINADAHQAEQQQTTKRKYKAQIFFRCFVSEIIIHKGKNKKTFDMKSKVYRIIDKYQDLN